MEMVDAAIGLLRETSIAAAAMFAGALVLLALKVFIAYPMTVKARIAVLVGAAIIGRAAWTFFAH